MCRKFALPVIDPATQQQLLSYARSLKGERRLAQRAQIILDWIEGFTYKRSSQKNQFTERVIAKWRGLFAKQGMAGLADAPWSVRPPAYTDADRARVIRLACQRTDRGTPLYNQQNITAQTGISQSWVSEIFWAAALRPHKTD